MHLLTSSLSLLLHETEHPGFYTIFFLVSCFIKQSEIVKANMASANGASYFWSFEEHRLSIMKIKMLSYYVRVE